MSINTNNWMLPLEAANRCSERTKEQTPCGHNAVQKYTAISDF